MHKAAIVFCWLCCVKLILWSTMELPKVEPVFVRAKDIPDFKSLKEFEMCHTICNRIESCKLLGVQRIGMLWRIYLKDKESRATLLASKLEIRKQCVNVFSNNPMRAKLTDGETDESVVKVTIKDLPISKGNKGIEVFLTTQGIKLKSAIGYAKARNDQNENSLNGSMEIDLCLCKSLMILSPERPGLMKVVSGFSTEINLLPNHTAQVVIKRVTTEANVVMKKDALSARKVVMNQEMRIVLGLQSKSTSKLLLLLGDLTHSVISTPVRSESLE